MDQRAVNESRLGAFNVRTYRTQVAGLFLGLLALLAGARLAFSNRAEFQLPHAEATLEYWNAHALSWASLSTGKVLAELAVALGLSVSIGAGFGCLMPPPSRPGVGVSNRVSLIANAIPAFLIVVLLRLRSGAVLPFDIGCALGVLNGFETARWVREERNERRHGSVAQAARALGVDAGGISRGLRPLLSRILGLCATRTATGVLGLQALLAFFRFDWGDVSTWGAFLGETVLRHQPLGAAAYFALLGTTALPLSVGVLIEALTRPNKP
jgi:ABC-type dipeptide/oligopeptide/nickel transport system permease subunit